MRARIHSLSISFYQEKNYVWLRLLCILVFFFLLFWIINFFVEYHRIEILHFYIANISLSIYIYSSQFYVFFSACLPSWLSLLLLLLSILFLAFNTKKNIYYITKQSDYVNRCIHNNKIYFILKFFIRFSVTSEHIFLFEIYFLNP